MAVIIFFACSLFILAPSAGGEVGETQQEVLAGRGPASRVIPKGILEGIKGDVMWLYVTPSLAVLFRKGTVIGEKEKRHSNVAEVMPEAVLLYPPRFGESPEKGRKTLTWFYENPREKWVMHRLLCRQIEQDSVTWDPETGKMATVKAPWKNYVVEWSLVVERKVYEDSLRKKGKRGGKP